MNNPTPDQIENIIEDALNAACLSVQTAIGQEDGGIAAEFFMGGNEETFRNLMRDYIAYEMAWRAMDETPST